MKRILVVVCFLVVGVINDFAQPCTFTVNAGPDTTICANQSAYLHGTVTPAGAYTYSWTPTSTLTGANTLTPVASPLDTTTYILSVTGGGCTAIDSVHVNVNGSALILFATDSPTTPLCPGQLLKLNAGIVPNLCGVGPACSTSNTSPAVGSGTDIQNGSATGPPTLLGNYVQSGRNQMLYTAAELTAALGGACTLKGVGFNIAIFNSNAYLQSFTISVACTNQTSLSTFDNNLVQVVAPTSIQPSSGWNDFGFTNPYNWDGTSNLIVDICWYDPQLYGNTNNKAQCTNTAPNTTLIYAFGTTDLCGTTNAPTGSTTERPNARFGYCLPNITDYPIVWTPAIGSNAVNKPDSADPTAHPITSQAYTIAVANGACVATKTLNVLVDTSYVTTPASISSCPGAPVTLVATAVGQPIPGPAQFSWSTSTGTLVGTGASVTVHPTVNTSYIVTMSGGACTHTATVNVTLGSLNVVAAPTNITCANLNNGKIIVTASNGSTPYSYTWVNTANTGNSNTATGLSPGTYTVTVNDVNSCSGTASAIITQPAALQTGPIFPTNVTCFGGDTGSIVVSPQGGITPYTYAWSNGLPATATQKNLTAGTYEVTITDANGCSVSSSIPVTQPTQITFGNAVIQNVKCPNSTTGQITVTPTGGSGAYTYKWSPNTTTQTANAQNLTAGTYNVTVTDAHFCTASSSNTVSAAIAVTFSAPTVTEVKCFGLSDGSATVNPSGGAPPYSYLWTPSGQTGQTATNLSAQTYTVSVTDDSMCVSTTTVVVTQPGAIVIVADSTNVLCNGNATGSINITATTKAATPVSYAWGASANNATTAGISNLTANIYAVTVTDANGCQANRSFNITQPQPLAITLVNQTNDACLNGATGSIAVSASGGTGNLKYTWSNTATSASITGLPAGNYTLTVTDASNCSATALYTITQPSTGPVFGQANVTNIACYGGNTGSITVNVSQGTPGYTYTWSSNAPQVNSPTVTGLTAGTYVVTATDAGGCTVSATNTVSQSSQIQVAIDTVINVSCNGGNNGSALLSASGGSGGNYTYTWNGAAGNNPEVNLLANTYTVVVTDGNACTASISVIVGQPAAIQDSIVSSNVRCFNGNDGSLTVYGYGGNPPFTYAWGDGTTTQLDAQLTAGIYSVTITDSKLCNTSATATLTQPALALSFTDSSTQVTCPGLQDGTISATGYGGTPPYSFSVTKDFANIVSTTSGIATQLDSGLYYITFNDANGCTSQDSIYVKYPIPDTFAVFVDSTSCFGAAYTDGSIYVNPLTLSNEPYTYTIDNGPVQDTSYFGNLAAGPHQIVAINQFGCKAYIDTTIYQPAPAYATVLPADTTLQLGQSIVLFSGFAPYSSSVITSYNWVPSLGLSCVDCPNPVATPYSHVTQYVLTITYNGICVASDSMEIIVDNHSKPFIPNSFSPNGDGNNDVFEIYGENIKTVNLRIFNRWGELVYESANQFKGWDGYYKGVLQNPGVYTYDAEITFLDNTQMEKHGSITLIR